jgi:hypothetical protein
MTMSTISRATILLGTLAMATSGVDAAGGLDTTFPVIPVAGTVTTAIPQSDGKILLGGLFSSVHGVLRANGARLLSGGPTDGTLDGTYNPSFNTAGQVNNILVLEDDNTMFCGAFTRVNVLSNNTPINFIAQFDSTGLVNSTFESPFLHAGYVTNSVARQGSSFILATNLGLHRIFGDGELDEDGFTEYPSGDVLKTLVKDDKIYLGGTFFAFSPAPPPPAKPPVNNWYFDRVGFSGMADATFDNPDLNGQVKTVALQTNGQILVGGQFTTVTTKTETTTTPVTQRALVRLHSNGAHDRSFAPTITNPGTAAVNCIAIQADGKILIGGVFDTVSSITGTTTTTLTRKGIARLNSNGTVDATFDAKINSAAYEVTSISILKDGKVLITGAFGSFVVGSSNNLRSKIVRLNNDPIVSDLRAVNDKTVRWMRGGAAAEVSAVTFEYSYDETFWIPLGTGTRIAGGWETSFANALPASCYLRALGTTTGGLYSGSSGIVTETANYPIPVIAVAPTGGSNVANGGTTTVAPVAAGTSREYSFDLKNTGTGELTSFIASITGPDADEFTLSSSPTPPVGGPTGIAPFTVNFAPDGMGTKTATLTVTGFDPDVEPSPYAITLKGNGVTEIEDWRFQYFGITTDTGNAAATADPDGDGHSNQFEYTAGLIPNSRASRFEQRVDATSGFARIIFSPIVAGRTYEVLTNTDLVSTWSAAVVGLPTDNGTERTVTETNPADSKRFYRVRITKP